MGPRGGARPRRERHRARLVACRHPSGSGESISRRGHARARTFSSRRAGSLRRSRAHRPRRRVGVSREGRRRDIFHVLQRLQRDFLFRVSARRLHGRVLNPQERCHRRVVLLQIRALFENLRPHVEGRRGRVSGCPGTPGINLGGGRNGKRESACSFPGDSGYDVPPPASRRPRFGRSRSVGRSESRGGRCPRMPLASASSDTPATSASASPSRPRQIWRVSRSGPAISREVGTRTGTRPELSRSSECAREERRRRTQRNGARLREGPFASVALARVRLCRLRCSFAALFGRNEETLSVCVAERRRARSSSNLGFPELLGGQTASFRSVAQRRSYTTRVEARVVARPLRWVQALGRTAGAAVEAAVAATRRAKATWLRES